MSFFFATYIQRRFFWIALASVLGFILSYLIPGLFFPVKILFFAFLGVSLLDFSLLFKNKKGIIGGRFTPDKLSNGDENPMRIFVENRYPFKADITIIDEIPDQFQRRDFEIREVIKPGEKEHFDYSLRPVKRGEYSFGFVNIYVRSPLGLLSRRYKFSGDKTVPVYPSFIQMRKYELMAISNQLTEYGIKKIRRVGHNMEFEQIKEYIQGDDLRTINWKATARRSQLMVNNYQDEKSQQVYSLIDKGRVMQMPFNGMTLLDYSINSSLVISNIAIKKSDKAGLITFQHRIGNIVPAAKRNDQMYKIQEVLYNQKTAYKETDFSRLFALLKNKVRQRSLLLLYTNFEGRVSLDRQLPFLRSIAKNHVLVVIFFENTELESLIYGPAEKLKAIYHKGIAEKFAYEKKWIVKELNKNGIFSILTKPEDLTVNTINKYLELKARGII